ncbi:MAG: AI-2E family transporter [Oscillospiraceae bacterium]|nr:AI-2E family transporter [Oscillospiraceae bacterium]
MDKKTVKTILFTAFLAAAVIAVAVKPEFFMGIISRTAGLLMPVFFGLAFAFVMNMPVCSIKKFLSKRSKRAGERTLNILSVISAYLLLIALIAGIVCIIVPQLIESVKLFFDNADYYYDNFMRYCTALEKRDSYGIFTAIKKAAAGLGEQMPRMLTATYARTSDIISGAADILIGFVISIYILLDKKNIRQAVSLIAERLTGEHYPKLCKIYRLVFTTFAHFVSGQITEAVILGFLCFIGMTVFRFDYPLLISTIIGITALIPVVGAIIGTVPAAFLLFLIKPVKAVWFIVFIIVLQLLENNLIYPRVVGKSLGIPPLLVLLAILLGAGLGGAAGILLGVPIMSVLYVALRERLYENAETDSQSSALL